MGAIEPTGAEDVRWRLEELYASVADPALEAELARGLEFSIQFEARYKGRIASLAPAEFVEMMTSLADHLAASSRPGLYAHLLHTQDTQDPAAGRLLARVREADAEAGRHLVFFSLELAQLDDASVDKLFTDPSARRYRHAVERERVFRPHQLSEVEEGILTEFSPTGPAAWSRLFEELCASVEVELEGARMPLAVALARLRDPSRETRERASNAITNALAPGLRTRAYIFNVLLQNKTISDRVRHYPSWISSRNLANEASDDSVQALIDAVTSRYDIVERYYRVKARLLGLEALYEWDRYAPVDRTQRRIGWSEAKELVIGSYRRFTPRAGDIVSRFFDQGWIDAPVVANKEGGAYCAFAAPGLHPYVMMNFTGELNDALTLAHELGHGLHDVLSGERNHIFDYHPPLTLAETASVFGETLTFDRIMVEEADPRVRLSMLCHQVEGSFATVFRQVAMNRFEDAVHSARRSRGELSQDEIADIWQEKVQAMFGTSLHLTAEHRNWWSYVEHFIHTPGYVYAYAFGNLLALSMYRRHLEGDTAFAEAYLAFLASGGSASPEAAVKLVGMDLAESGFWAQGIDIIDSMVKEVERLAAS